MQFPALKPQEVVRALQKAGFEKIRQKGSHLCMLHEKQKRMIIVPLHKKDLKRGLLHSIIKDAGMTKEEFQELL